MVAIDIDVLILHGWSGSSSEHWQHWLESRLAIRGLHVQMPTLPDPDEPDLDEWLTVLQPFAERLTARSTVVTHSLGCVLWMHALERGMHKISRLVLVAPPSPTTAIPEVRSFFPMPAPSRKLGASADLVRVIASENDPWCPEGAPTLLADWNLDHEELPGAGHINETSGFGPWADIERFVLGETTTVVGGSRRGTD